MRLAKIALSDGSQHVASWNEDDTLQLLDLSQVEHCFRLVDVLHHKDPVGLARFLVAPRQEPIPLSEATLLAPLDQQEVWAAGVTYKRSQVARMEESEEGASHYDRVYMADRPELFFKATASRVSGPGEPVRVRADSDWSVPEPEFTLVISPDCRIVGYTIGNDMSARDIEGENPLYLPQAKFYKDCCSLGPCVWLAEEMLDSPTTTIKLRIERGGEAVICGKTNLGELTRTLEELADWLYREQEFPNGAMLLTGTGIVPDDEFSLIDGDVVHIEITGIGTLTNPVVKDKLA